MSVTTASLWQDERPQRSQAEQKLQAQVMRYLAYALPSNAIPHHSPGEGKRTPTAQRLLKQSGYQTGWPDIEILWNGRTIFIELKAKGGSLSPVQRDLHNRLVFCGFEVIVCRSLECVEGALRELGVPLRARLS